MQTEILLQCLAILSAAATSQHGIVVRTDDPHRARQMLYRAKKDVGDTTLDQFQIRVSPDDSEREIWLVRRQSAATM